MVDIDEERDFTIETHGLTGADDVYTFYHDETNNIRKLHVKPDASLNVPEMKVFVLGGVMHSGAPHEFDLNELRSAMRIQSTADEIKLTHVAKGEFLDVLQSTKLTVYLRWISENGLKIHYQTLDPFFWSVADIIDSILPFIESGSAAVPRAS